MINDIKVAQECFKEKIGAFLLAVQTRKVIDSRLLQEADAQARLMARLLKDTELVSKSLLNELLTAARILRAEAPYVGAQSDALIKMAEKLELTFELILLGECHCDRVPGVPRVL